MPKRSVKRKPEMPDALRERAIEAKAKLDQKWPVPGFISSGGDSKDGGPYRISCPFRGEDEDHWLALVAEALGTRSMSVINYSLDALAEICTSRWQGQDEGWQPEPVELNTALAIIAACEVENEAQAALAMQMVALHFTGMKLGKLAGRYTYGADERSAATQARVARTMAALQESLARLQGKIQPRAINQTITVIHIDNRDQRQQTAVMGGKGNFGGQAQPPYSGRTLEHEREKRIESASPTDERGAALPSPCQDNGAAVLRPCGERQAGVSDARWIAWFRRAFGRA